MRSFLFVFVWCFSFGCVLAQAPRVVPLSDKEQTYALEPQAAIMIDSSKSLAFEQVLQPAQQKRFKTWKQKSLSFGYFYKPIWVKIQLRNLRPQTDWILEIPSALIDTVHFFQKTPHGWEKLTYGYRVPHSRRQIKHTGFAYQLSFVQDTSTVYVCVLGTNPKNIPLRVLEKEHFNEKVRHEDIAYGIFFGVMIIMFCYNLMIFIALRDVNYLLYMLTLLCTLLLFGAVSGYAGKYLWSETPFFNAVVSRLGLGALGVSVSLFSMRFLEVRQYSAFGYYLLWCTTGLSVLGFVLVATQLMPSASNLAMSISNLSFIVVGCIALYHKKRVARFYLMGWGFYSIGGGMIILRNIGVLGHGFWTAHMVEISAACETFLLALALSDKYRSIKQTRESALNEAYATLEQKVQERTQELQERNAEIQERNEELVTLNEEIRQYTDELIQNRDALTEAYARIEHQNLDILDSLGYAKRIQDALLPTREQMAQHFADMMLFHQPKDIVSGDFYWFAAVDSWDYAGDRQEGDGLSLIFSPIEEIHNKIIFLAVADCTGHGVPGAFMTMISAGLLDQIIRRDKVYSPAQILAELDARLQKTLRQRNKDGEQVQDGMDISLLRLDTGKRQIVWAGAKRPLWIIEKGRQDFTTYKGDRYPVGGSQFSYKNFTEQEINLQEGDVVYAFSDGYADQFGAEGKLTIRRFKQLLLENRFKPFATQELLLQHCLEEWRGQDAQTDDILVVGLKI